MPGEKVSTQTRLSTVPDDADLYIIYSLAGVWYSRKCSKAELLAEITARVVDLETAVGGGDYQTKKEIGKSASFVWATAANTYVDRVDVYYGSGTPTLKIGLTPAGEETLIETAITENISVPVFKPLTPATTFYFTITGTGILSFVIRYKNENL